MRVLGVDPGLTRCGIGAVDGRPGRPPSLVHADVIRTPAGADIAARLLALEEEIDTWLAEYRPESVAVERVFSQHNVRTVMGTAQAGAVAVLGAARAGLPVQMYTPSEVKAAVTGSGQADKVQVTTMVTRLLRMPSPPRPADAVRKAVAGGDTATLTRVPGIGKKSAERLVLELRDRIGPVVVPVSADGSAAAFGGTWPDQVRQALIGLGWTAGQADQAVAAVA